MAEKHANFLVLVCQKQAVGEGWLLQGHVEGGALWNLESTRELEEAQQGSVVTADVCMSTERREDGRVHTELLASGRLQIM